MCVFENCSTKFNPYSASRHHFRLKHLNTGDIQLKAVHSLGSSSNPLVMNPELASIGDGELEEGVGEEGYDAFDIDALENMETFDEDVGSEDYFLEYYADFYNRLVHHKFLPQSTVQDICEEYFKSSKKSQEIRERKLRETLERVADLSPEEVNEIVKDVVEDDFFIRAQSKLNTQYKRTKYVQENMKYCAPIEILLNKSEVEKGLAKDVIHYVPLDLSIKTLVEDASMIQMMEKERGKEKQNSGRIADIKDGSQIRNNPFFHENPGASGILLYSDGVELVNPLGAARGVYKIVQMFYTLVDIPKNQRSQVDKLQLAMIFKEKLLKKYSTEVIYKRIIDDLKTLENGIVVNIPEPTLTRFGLLLYSSDNLEAHTIGSFFTPGKSNLFMSELYLLIKFMVAFFSVNIF